MSDADESKKHPPGAGPVQEPDEEAASKAAQEQALRDAAAKAVPQKPGPTSRSASRAQSSGQRTPASHTESFMKKDELKQRLSSLANELSASRQMAEKQQDALASLEKRLLARDAEFAGQQLAAQQLAARNAELEAQLAV